MSDSLSVTNGVHQGGILSPYLFCVYMDDLGKKLNTVNAGCIIYHLELMGYHKNCLRKLLSKLVHHLQIFLTFVTRRNSSFRIERGKHYAAI